MRHNALLRPISAWLLLCFLFPGAAWAQSAVVPIDKNATKRTKAVFLNLQQSIQRGKWLFGHQDDLAYGVGWKEKPGASDVKAVCGDFPAVYGWELGNLEHDMAYNLDSVNFDRMKGWIKEGYRRGGVITISWHMDNYATGGSAWDTTAAVHKILPGGPLHERFKADLDRFAVFVNDLRAGGLFNRRQIPIIFRPFHELSGSWFWWGKGHTNPDDFIALWRFTVSYLRDVKDLHNILYAYNTSENFKTADEFLQFYPGDAWVDILSFDDYGNLMTPDGELQFQKCLKTVVEIAEARNKIPALAETGLEGIKRPDWYTSVLLKNIQADPVGKRIAYVVVWRNANRKHHYVPYPGHPGAADFQAFYQDDSTLFEQDLRRFYKKPKPIKPVVAPLGAKMPMPQNTGTEK